MTQLDFGTIDPDNTDGTELASMLNNWRDTVHSLHKGSAQPSYAVAGQLWIKDSVSPWEVYCFDGLNDILIGTLDTSADEFAVRRSGLDDSSL